MAYPSTPTSLYINGSPETAGKLTRNTSGTVAVSAVINDPDSRDKVRMVVRYSKDPTFKSYRTAASSFGRQGVRHRATMTGLARNTRYYVRVYTQQRDRLLLSRRYNVNVVLDGQVARRSRFRWPRRVSHFAGAAVPEPVRHRVHPACAKAAEGGREPGGLARRSSWRRRACRRPPRSPPSTPGSRRCGARPLRSRPPTQAAVRRRGSTATTSGTGRMLRRIYSERSVLETMTEFWSNHLHIPEGHDAPGSTASTTTRPSASTRWAPSRTC